MIIGAGSVVLLCTILALCLLVWPAPLITFTSASDQLDALRTALLIGGASAGAITLLLAARRQVHGEHVAHESVLDATERRMTELYVKAVEQLGSDKAPVRLGGLHALERLANLNPDYRQTVVDVICSYLRMPFNPEVDFEKSTPARIGIPSWSEPYAVLTEASAEEREVRRAAQDILCGHLQGSKNYRNYDATRWGPMNLNLSGATLIDLDAQNMVIKDTSFMHARFVGLTMFNDTKFSGYANFKGSVFEGSFLCESVEFDNSASLIGATFNKTAYFRSTTFGGRHSVRFRGARFLADCYLHRVRFVVRADFHGAEFYDKVTFAGSEFANSGEFRRFKLADDPFENGTESGSAEFAEARFYDDVTFENVKFSGQAGFEGAYFYRGAEFDAEVDAAAVTLAGSFVCAYDSDDATIKRKWPLGIFEVAIDPPPEGALEGSSWNSLVAAG